MFYFSSVKFSFYIWSCRAALIGQGSRRNPSSIHIGKTKADYTPRKANRRYLIIVYGHWIGQRKSEITLRIEDVILRKQHQTWMPPILSRSNQIELKTAPVRIDRSRGHDILFLTYLFLRNCCVQFVTSWLHLRFIVLAPILEVVNLSFRDDPSSSQKNSPPRRLYLMAKDK